MSQSKYFAYQGELREMITIWCVEATNLLDLGAHPLLPRRVAREQHDGPRQQERGRLVPREEERFALIHYELQIEAKTIAFFLLLHFIQKHS